MGAEGLTVIGVGASAGGLEAFTDLLANMPRDAGMAIVFVQHLDPHHRSNLASILSRTTSMPVAEALDGTRLEPNRVYVVPPDGDLAVLHGVLRVMPREEHVGVHMPIDAFFRSLAEDCGNRAVGVVLSGSGSDGALGLRAIKAEGGITFAQDESSAKYGGMPSSAALSAVDFVLPPREIAHELARIGRHPRVQVYPGRVEIRALPEDDLQKVFIMLRRSAGVDFTYYKRSTVERRIARRMVLQKIESLRQYVKFLQQSPEEVGALFEDMLINVTSFFRDPDSFEALKTSVFPRILQERGRDVPLRLWVPACSTGEEAYSLAIALMEFLGKEEAHWTIQIFATDISNEGVHRAREGRYPENIAADVSPERLRRYFLRTDTGYQITKAIRDMCVVARQNVIKDPPFSNLDLISCRNLLIYMGPTLQKRIIPTFHYALRHNGFLVLGASETVGSFADLFALADKKHKFYVKKSSVARLPVEMGPVDMAGMFEGPSRDRRAAADEAMDFDKEVDRLILARLGLAGVVVDGEMNVLHFRGQTGRFLEPAPGQASLNLLKLAREGLSLDLRTAVHKARLEKTPVRKEGLQVKQNGHTLAVSLEVVPFRRGERDDWHFLVLFEEAPPAGARKSRRGDKRAKDSAAFNRQLEDVLGELAETKETLRTIIEQHETTNEELRAANEEIQSSNEELQSTNEELETAKEELQSTNEELTTLNEELENRNRELTQTINDYNNLLASVDIPIVILNDEGRIRLYTPMAAKLLNLIPADRGRPLRELNLGMQIDNLEQRIHEVLDKLHTQDEEIQMRDGRWCSLRIRPYKTADNKIEGVVLAMVDITERRRLQQCHPAADKEPDRDRRSGRPPRE